MVITVLLLAAAYLCGSLPFGYWAGKLKGIDIRQHGSGNIGATNVIRVLGKGIGIPVFALDVVKGLVPVVLPPQFLHAPEAGPSMISAVQVGCGLAAVLGHMFTCWLQFKGGKGVATATGVLLGIAPIAMLIGLVLWIVVFSMTKYVSLASMVAAVAIPITMAVLMMRAGEWNWILLGFGILIAALVVLRHRANISRLLAGTENRAGGKKK